MSAPSSSTPSNQPEPSRLRGRIARIASFCYLWLLVGFVLGTAVLVWPVRWLTAGLQRAGAGQQLENVAVITLVALYVAASFLAARRFNVFVCNCGSRWLRVGSVGVATLLASSTAWAWHDPGAMLSAAAGGGAIGSLATKRGAVFEFGAYPDSARLVALKAHGVTTIVSLQDANIPVERDGVREERQLARALGMAFVNAPMVPWFSDNTASLAEIRSLAEHGRGHYYVHCGLGRDRVNIAKRVIEGTGATAVATADLRPALGFDGRKADFQQGSLTRLAPNVWLVPFPEREELYSCFFEGRPGRVVLLLDPANAVQDSLLAEARSMFRQYNVPFEDLPLRDGPAEAQQARAIADSVRRLSPPVTVIAYRTPWHDGRQPGDEAAVAFRDAFAPAGTWAITTGTVKMTKGHVYTGGKETGC